MRKVILYYFYFFLIIDSITGFLLSRSISAGGGINPGEIVRSFLFLILLCLFLKDLISNRLKKDHKYILILLIVIIFNLFYYLFNVPNFFSFLIEISITVKVLFFLLLVYYVSKNKSYFLTKFDKIILINFTVLTINLFVGYFWDIGLITYERSGVGNKGFLDGGNVASVFSLIFFIFYLFKSIERKKYLISSSIALFNMYVVGTKVIFFAPILIMFFLYKEVNYLKKSTILPYIGIIILIVVGSIYYFQSLQSLYEERYMEGLESANIEFIYGDVGEEAILNYRRIDFAIRQVNTQFKELDKIIMGYGNYGQIEYWQKNSPYKYTFSAMDFVDFLFKYGIISTTFLIVFITKIIAKSSNDIIKSLLIVFLFYSFFGGYVLFIVSSSTFLALIAGIKT